MRLTGLFQRGFPAALLGEIEHSDAQRTRFFDIQDKRLQSQINQLYLQIKVDLFRLRGTFPTEEENLAIYAHIQRTLSSPPDQPGQPRSVTISLPALTMATAPHNEVCQLYSLQLALHYNVQNQGAIAAPEIPALDVTDH
jgi:hypothetical protein